MTNLPETAPFTSVDEVLAAAAAPASPTELRGQAAALAAFREARPAPVSRRPRRILAGRAVLAGVGVLGLVTAGSAAAATGSLPDAAQDAAREALIKVGVDVPRGKGLVTAPGQQKTAKDKTPKEDGPKPDAATGQPDPAKSSGQGATISSIAHDPTLAGAEKGAAVSAAASDGKSHAGQNTPAGPPSSLPAGPPVSSPSDTAPGKTTSATAGPKGPPAAPGKGRP